MSMSQCHPLTTFCAIIPFALDLINCHLLCFPRGEGQEAVGIRQEAYPRLKRKTSQNDYLWGRGTPRGSVRHSNIAPISNGNAKRLESIISGAPKLHHMLDHAKWCRMTLEKTCFLAHFDYILSQRLPTIMAFWHFLRATQVTTSYKRAKKTCFRIPGCMESSFQ